MTKIFLIRHGESIANTQGIYQGQTYDTDLSDLGLRQAQALRVRFKNIIFDRIFVSPLKRTRQTAKNLNGPKQETTEILETNHGQWEGLPKNEIAVKWPETYNLWLTKPAEVEFPNGERFVDTVIRVTTWFDDLVRQSGTYAVVTHANVIQILLIHINSLDPNYLWNFTTDSTGVTLVEANSPPKIIYTNDTSHLKGLKSDISVQAI